MLTCYRAGKEVEISPGSMPSTTSQQSRSAIAPWETPNFGDYRKELAVLDTSGRKREVPSISRQPPTAISPQPQHPWTPGSNGTVMPSSVFGSFFNDSSEDISQLSPGFRPGSGKEEMGFPGDDRRPSVASATTVSSSGSKSSVGRGFHKKLQGFFGDEYPGDSRQNSDTSLANQIYGTVGEPPSQRARNRNNSMNNTISSSLGSRPASPASSRPRTPLPPSEVTPWEYQDTPGGPKVRLGSLFFFFF
jgi:adenylate cyclase